MKSLRKILTIMVIIAFTLQFASILVPHIAFGEAPNDFVIRNYYVMSSADTPNIYPGSKRVYLKIEAAYQNSTTNATMVFGWLKTPDDISFSYGSDASPPAKFNGSVIKEVSLGTVVTFEYFLDISPNIPSDLLPLNYYLTLNITYLKDSTSTYDLHSDEIIIEVQPYPEVSLRVVDAYFSPASYLGSVDTNLYVVLENNGSSTINSANFNVTLPVGFTVKNPRASTGPVNRGDRFTITFTGVSIPLNAQLRAYSATICADYSARTEDGVTYSITSSFNVTVMVESPPPEEPIMVAAVNTLYNGEPAPLLQSAKGVVLRIYLINRLPDTISTMIVNATLPENITVRGVSGTYINGMGPGGTCFVELTIDVAPEIEVGRHYCSLNITYLRIVSSSSFLMNQTLRFQINIESRHSIIDDSSAIEIVDVRWYEGSVGPNTYGAHLIVFIRNVCIDGLHGAVLELDLPEGICNSADNSSRVKATPLSVQLQLPQPLQAQDLVEILNAFLSAQIASPAQVYSRGDILTFMFSLNLFNIEVKNYTLSGRLSYIDMWGGNRKIQLTVPVTVLGKAGYIELAMDKNLRVRSRYVNTSLTLVNHGSSPLYDAYIVISPYQGTPILIASPAVNYVEKIHPGEERLIPVSLAYNPLGFYYQAGAASYLTYGPVPLMVSVFYKDAGGYYRNFNNSVTVTVEPFIELLIRNIRATGTNSSSTVTGIIINYGSSAAYRVEVEVKIGDAVQSENIGDVEPGAEVAFRVDIDKYNSTALLTVRYYNIFNERESKEMGVSITLREEAVPPPVQAEEWLIERWVIVVGVIVFLAISTMMIYKMMKKSRLAANP
ncbi:MAG: hypothetical protein QXX79_04010 [Candidatus Bathyarchaeia archaeon]